MVVILVLLTERPFDTTCEFKFLFVRGRTFSLGLCDLWDGLVRNIFWSAWIGA